MTEPYAQCNDCGVKLQTQEDSREHMRQTIDQNTGRSHGILIVTPTREQEMDHRVQGYVADALDDFCAKMDRLVGRGDMSENEVKAALVWWPDFGDAWDEWMQEGDE